MAHGHSQAPLPVQSQVAPSSCLNPSTEVTLLHPCLLSSMPLLERLAVLRCTPGCLRAHLGAAPVQGPRRAHPAWAGAGTPLLGGRNRCARPLPQEATAPRLPTAPPNTHHSRPRPAPHHRQPAEPTVQTLATCRDHRSSAQLLFHFRLPPPALGPGHVATHGQLTRKRLAAPAGVSNPGLAWGLLP